LELLAVNAKKLRVTWPWHAPFSRIFFRGRVGLHGITHAKF